MRKMNLSWRFFVVVIFLAGFFVSSLLGTSSSMTFVWPGYLVLGLAGALSIGMLFNKVSYSLSRATAVGVFAVVGYFIIRAADSPINYFAREDATLLIAAFLCYVLFLSLFTSASSRNVLILTLAAVVLANLGMALYQSLFNSSAWLLPGYERTDPDRVSGLFNHPDHFAAFIGSLASLWFAVAVYGRGLKRTRLSYLVLGVISFAVVTFAGSGQAVVSLFSGLAILGLMMVLIAWKKTQPSFRRRFIIGAGCFLLIGTIVVFAANGPIKRQITRSLLTKSESVSLPLLWKSAVSQMAEAPVLGTGSRTSYFYSRLFRSESLDPSVNDQEFAHNEYLQVAADYGLVGFLIFMGFIALHVSSGFRFAKSYFSFGGVLPKSDHLAYVVGALAVLAGMGVASCFDFVMHLPVFALTASILMAVLAVPDPMASALEKRDMPTLPGGSVLFAHRSLACGCGVAFLIFGVSFARSEYHYEMARIAFEADRQNFKQFTHLHKARELDPLNPFAYILSGHAQVATITSHMASPERKQILEKADQYFSRARDLYPQDIFTAVGHVAVLDELGQKDRALQRLTDARDWAPLYGNLMLAEAEHYLRNGEVNAAQVAYASAMNAKAFRDADAARVGLETISEWRLIAARRGIEVPEPPTYLANKSGIDGQRTIEPATVGERTVAGEDGKLLSIPDPE